MQRHHKHQSGVLPRTLLESLSKLQAKNKEHSVVLLGMESDSGLPSDEVQDSLGFDSPGFGIKKSRLYYDIEDPVIRHVESESEISESVDAFSLDTLDLISGQTVQSTLKGLAHVNSAAG